MSVTVGEIMRLPALAGAFVAAGRRGLDSPVRWIHVAEIPDIARLLSGGELVLTTGMGLADRSPDGLRQYVHSLHRIGAAGIGLELVRHFAEVPPAMAAVADSAALPIIAFPHEVPFVRVTQEAHTLIVNRQFARVQEAEAVAGALNSIALSQEGVAAILAALSRVIGNPVACVPVSRREQMVAHPAGALERADLERLREAAAAFAPEVQVGGARGLCWPIRLGAEHWGALVLLERDRRIAEPDLLVAGRAAVTVAFELLRRRSMHRQWHVDAAELLEDILADPDPDELLRRAAHLGLDLAGRTFAVAAVAVSGPAERRAVEQRLRGAVARHGGVVLIAARAGRVRLLTAAPDPRAATDGLLRLLAAAGERPAGIGRPFRDLAAAPQALDQAEATLALRRQHPQAGFGPLFDTTGAYRVLLGAGEAARAVARELAPLGGDPDLLATLRTLLDLGLNMAEAARRMHLTRQAVYYRRERLEALLACTLDDPERRLSLSLALRALDLERLRIGAGQAGLDVVE